MEKTVYITEEEWEKCRKVMERLEDCSNRLFEGLWEEWFNLNVFLLAREMQLADVLYDDLFNNLPKEKQSELIGRKDGFAKKAGITP